MTQAQPTPSAGQPHALRLGASFPDLPVLGYHDPSPHFSWQLPTGSAGQSAYRVVVSVIDDFREEGVVWDSGKVESDRSQFVPFAGEPIKSRDRVWWRVQTWNEQGEASLWSEAMAVEMGLLSRDDWDALWIHTREPGERPHPCPHFRRAFMLTRPVASARLYITSRGIFEAHLNGRRVGDDALTPGWTEYHKRLHTLTYDATNRLQQGDNALGAILADGWYGGMGLRVKWTEAVQWGPRLELLAQLEVTFTDGSTQRITTDEHWRTTLGPITLASLYDGETHDARRELDGWCKPGYEDSAWEPVVTSPLDDVALDPKPMPQVRAIEVLKPTAMTQPEPGRYVFDFGQNMVGVPRLRVPMKQDATLTVRFAEMLQKDGTLYTENYREADSTDRYIAARDGVIDWQPRFTFHGFRYVELSGFDPSAMPVPEWVDGVVLHTPMQPTGAFTSSHAKLNRLQRNIVWGQKGNFLEVPTDCPQRDERLGWTGDAQAFCPTACFNFDTLAFWRKWLRDLHDSQHDDGALPHVSPDLLCRAASHKKHAFGSAGWGDAGTVVPWEVYVRSGDLGVLESHYDMMTRWVGWWQTQATDHIADHLSFGDWLQPYAQNKQDDKKGDTPQALICTAYFARSADLTARAAALLGQSSDAKRYRELFENVCEAFVGRFFDADAKLTTEHETQTAYLLALGFDLLPESKRDKAIEHLVRLVHEANDHLRTGFLGTPLLCPVLDRFGHTDLAYKVLLTDSYPSWFYSIDQGATTMWERWNSYSHADGFGDAGMNSFNHYAYGAIGQWMYERIAGLTPDPDQPGYKHFFVQPTPGGGLTQAAATLETAYGRAASSWQIVDGTFTLDVEVPPNTTATVTLPGQSASEQLAAGSHRFTSKL